MTVAEPIDLLKSYNNSLKVKNHQAEAKSQRASWATFTEILPAEGGPALGLTGKSGRAPAQV